ncbi:hypothetical protein I6N95_11445 [Vagococcus sp. BWB3-3]|uniref:Uncharacterized protein n=1 Tax=Vagococcus allomyrinae TaxID=2794353 RepID=A0A940SW17_9ENTE|nr:hypothetical protein [Vagococcus allomyrinae]MBP1041621.1 hypothetical protein [Vagococcus allomyrinae]
MFKFIKNHSILVLTVIIGGLLVIIPLFQGAIEPNLTIDGMYNFVGSFFGVLAAVMLAFSENKAQNQAIRDEIELNARKERTIQAEFLYREMLFQKIENLYAKLNTCIYQNEESIRLIKYNRETVDERQMMNKLLENQNQSEKLIHDIELLSIYFHNYQPNIEQIVVLFERSRDHLALLEVKLTTEESVEFNDKVEAYIEFLDDLDQLLDDLSIDLLKKMKVEVVELANLSSLDDDKEH